MFSYIDLAKLDSLHGQYYNCYGGKPYISITREGIIYEKFGQIVSNEAVQKRSGYRHRDRHRDTQTASSVNDGVRRIPGQMEIIQCNGKKNVTKSCGFQAFYRTFVKNNCQLSPVEMMRRAKAAFAQLSDEDREKFRVIGNCGVDVRSSCGFLAFLKEFKERNLHLTTSQLLEEAQCTYRQLSEDSKKRFREKAEDLDELDQEDDEEDIDNNSKEDENMNSNSEEDECVNNNGEEDEDMDSSSEEDEDMDNSSKDEDMDSDSDSDSDEDKDGITNVSCPKPNGYSSQNQSNEDDDEDKTNGEDSSFTQSTSETITLSSTESSCSSDEKSMGKHKCKDVMRSLEFNNYFKLFLCHHPELGKQRALKLAARKFQRLHDAHKYRSLGFNPLITCFPRSSGDFQYFVNFLKENKRVNH